MEKAEIKKETREILAHYQGRADELIPILQETQEHFRYLPEDAMSEVARFVRVPESTVYGVSTFYALFKLTPAGKHIVRVCRGTACHVRGSLRILEEMEKQLGIKAGETRADLEWTLETISCFGSCALAPVMVIDKTVYGRMTPPRVRDILSGGKAPEAKT